MNSRQRLQRTTHFREPDRVPIELQVGAWAKALPEVERIADFIDREADNFLHTPLVDWGFLGLSSDYREEIIEDVSGQYRRIRRTHDTESGSFCAVTRHSYENPDSADFRWERRFIHDLRDMERLAAASRKARPFDLELYGRHDREIIADRGLPVTGLFHPLGSLVRNATMTEVYVWLLDEPALMHRFLDRTTEQTVNTVRAVGETGLSPWFVTVAHEMLIPPWFGMELFREWVYPYDKAVNDAVHAIGGKCRSHCHGNCMDFLEIMSEMGVDATEPLEPPPFGNVDLAEAKRRMQGKMVLSGNVASQRFLTDAPSATREMVKRAIDAAASGGGFTLHTTGGHAGLAEDLTSSQRQHVIAHIEAYIETGLEYGVY